MNRLVYIIHTTNGAGESTILCGFEDEDVAEGFAENLANADFQDIWISEVSLIG